ncbi:unnamed protein product [Effrenium voratum]|nr:unnamed protein product [Effrenium voratum]
MLKALHTMQLEVEAVQGHVRGAWLQLGTCTPDKECYMEQIHLVFLLAILVGAIVAMLCAFGFFREELCVCGAER